jgi:hypothetical protein
MPSLLCGEERLEYLLHVFEPAAVIADLDQHAVRPVATGADAQHSEVALCGNRTCMCTHDSPGSRQTDAPSTQSPKRPS